MLYEYDKAVITHKNPELSQDLVKILLVEEFFVEVKRFVCLGIKDN